MTGPAAKSVKPPRTTSAQRGGAATSGARALVKAAQSAGEKAEAAALVGRRAQAGEARRASILAAALSVFARLGLEGASVDAIARAAGLSKANLLYYYPSKDALYVAVLEQGLSRWLAPLASFRSEDDPAEAIGALIAAKLAMSRDHPEVSRLFALEMLRGAPLLKPVLAGPLKAVFDAKVAVIRAWVAAGRLAPVEPAHLIFAIWALTQHYADFAVQVRALTGASLSDQGFMEDAATAVTALVLDGVRPR